MCSFKMIIEAGCNQTQIFEYGSLIAILWQDKPDSITDCLLFVLRPVTTVFKICDGLLPNPNQIIEYGCNQS